MPTPSSRRTTVGPVVAPRIGRQRLPWQDEPSPAPAQPGPPPEEPDAAGERDGGGGVIGLVVVVVVLLLVLPAAFWVMDYGGLNPFATTSPSTDQPPSALAGPGSYVDARVQPGGTVRVTQWVRSTDGLRAVSLVAQPRSGRDAAATGLRLRAGGRPVAGPSSVGHDVVGYRWRTSARVVRLTYTLGGVVDETRTTARRTVLASTFLAVRYPGKSGPTVVRVSGAGVRGVSCAPVTGAGTPAPCGRQVTSADWQVVLKGADRSHRVLTRLGAS